MKKHVLLFMSLTLLINLVGCNNSQTVLLEETETKLETVQMERDKFKLDLDNANIQLKNANKNINELEEKVADLEKAAEEANNEIEVNYLVNEANIVLDLIKTKNYAELSNHISADGVRFSPYINVDTENHVLLQASDFSDESFIDEVRTWGTYDGSGNEISYDFNAYYDEFIYNQDFLAAPMIGNNFFLSTGNMINNIATVYPEAEYVEYHFPDFDPEYEGMDWQSLILVFENTGTEYKLLGIVHNQWTS